MPHALHHIPSMVTARDESFRHLHATVSSYLFK
ncbi:hypothetical protein YPC_1286 [Yersinia pestis biovar Medievalis str. Harbin 35]|nr:hypothetical protein YPC_1286 [Yersinia pestis biovar Medievalis str. Harbin 35]EEO77748.1 hypothetical protein YP516_1433 [Yersinia pestis Nepal516]EEO79994.1 hypothetical protein YPF_3423 [Yersinia pestis biovar Orientalis str. India 195]EEO84823.1 hypothetical protein YPH_0646 [Yersinia pestis biovar Orientalis str. PEXU2]EEO89580.1 hypothetical protein YPS_3183 [Yersinia pestis Pestoides A]